MALAQASGYAQAPRRPRRVGLIGCGWYGKIDLFRLIQVEPVEVVSLCDVDRNMLQAAAGMTAERQASHKTPRTFHDYRQMLAEKDLDIVLIATPDHWHALPMIEAVKSGADVYVQKPIAVDVVEAEAMLAAARKYEPRGAGRNAAPQHAASGRGARHDCAGRQAGQDRPWSRSAAITTCARPRIRPTPTARLSGLRNVDRPRAHAALQRAGASARWRAFMEYGNGIVGDMCIHMFDMVRWMMGLGWPKRISSEGGIFVDKASKANITDTQTVTFAYDDLDVVWTHRSWGASPDPKYDWAAILYGDKGTLKAGVYGYDFIPNEKGRQAIHKDVTYELEQYPEDKTEKDLERHVAPAVRYHMKNLLAAIDSRGKPVSDIEQGYISTASCIMGNLALKTGRTLQWDPEKRQIVGDPEANRLLRRPYRAPWVHPDPATV